MHSAVEEHFRATENLIRQVPADDISTWLLKHGYFPESNVLPPSFSVCDFSLNKDKKLYKKDVKKLAKKKLCDISYPKTLLNSRVFSLQYPDYYHDILINLNQNWDDVIDHLFHEDIKIYSYSFPIPVDKSDEGNLGKLRTGRMIYEWIEMAEKDLIIDSRSYKFLVRTDITNFYSSIYTHSIGWALHGREKSQADREYKCYGNRIDRLFQYSNDARTNGIPVGSALSDLIAEIILAAVDKSVSQQMQKTEYLAVRFKDDYRVLCQTEEDGRLFLRILTRELANYNLHLNENKTVFLTLPDGLYRQHDREYFPHSLRKKSEITFKEFEHTLLIALDIHRRYPGTSILEKFLSELTNKDYTFKVKLNSEKQVRKAISLLILLQKESTKLLAHSLSLIEVIYRDKHKKLKHLKKFLRHTLLDMIQDAAKNASTFELVWLIFFAKYLELGISEKIKRALKALPTESLPSEVKNNDLYKSVLISKEVFFESSQSMAKLFRNPRKCKDSILLERLDVFRRN